MRVRPLSTETSYPERIGGGVRLHSAAAREPSSDCPAARIHAIARKPRNYFLFMYSDLQWR
jgi:hypothetical protein